MSQHIECPHCGSHHHIAPHSDFDGMCSCGEDIYCPPLPEDDIDYPAPGDIYGVADGLKIITPHGPWILDEEGSLKLLTGLSAMIHHLLTNPWSADDPSTILSRGRREVTEVEPMPAAIHEIKPANSKPLTAAEHGDKTALNGNTVAYNIGHQVLESLYKVPADEVLTFFDAEGSEDLESTLQWWHENINDEA